MDQQEQQQQEHQNQQVSSTPIVTVTKRDTKVKNPKCVEQGKHLAEHNRKIKLQLAQMQKAETAEPNQSSRESFNVDSRLLDVGGFVVVGGLGLLLLKHFGQPQQHPEIHMSPLPPQVKTTPPPSDLDME